MKIRLFVFISILIQPLMSLGQSGVIKQYIDSFKNIAMQEMIEYKIPASITLAQGLLESGSGNSRLAKEGNNHFGIKCKKDWTGCKILEDDDALQECFRCYTTAEESYRDHSRFLKDNKRYAALFVLDIMDYKAWAKGLLSAGYATNQKYADLLISTIERNRLARFDTMIQNGHNPYSGVVQPNIDIVDNKVPSTVVQPNQTVKTIAEVNHKSERKLDKYNDLKYHKAIEPGDVLYLRPKKRKASVPNHEVKDGETMWEISQKYAIKISSLYKKNLMEPGTEPAPGTVLQLQHKAMSRPDTGRVKKTEINNSAETDFHVVASGETLYSISRIYSVSVDELIRMNQLVNTQLQIGQKLKIKESANLLAMKKHVVKSGETLYSISRIYGVSISDIKIWNNLESESLKVGQILEIKSN
ncbi:MAG TPA: LysM peptidoglycan-binding domain-containing protein [Bacteroidia bacterium]